MSIRISTHATQRARERAGLKRCSLDRLLPRVLEEGISASETTGRLRGHLDSVSQTRGYAAWVYGEHIYMTAISNEGIVTLVTVLPLPTEHKQAVAKIR